MKTTIHYRAFQNTYVGLISFILSFAQTIIAVPILLAHWGNAPYAVWLALFAGFSLIQTLDTGHINFIGNQINVLYHVDKNDLRKTLGSAIYIALLLGIVELIFILILILEVGGGNGAKDTCSIPQITGKTAPDRLRSRGQG